MKLAAMPLWLRWVFTLLAFGVFAVAVVIFVSRSRAGEPTYSESPAAAAQANRQGQAVSAQDQAAHEAQLPRPLAAQAALERAIVLDMRTRVGQHDIAGPVQNVSCHQVLQRRSDRLLFRCRAQAGGFNYPFAGVVDVRTAVLTWCKDDRASYNPAVEAPLSRSCTS